MADTSLAIFQPFLKEIHCDKDGHGSVTRRGVARLVDASEKSIRVLLKKVEEGAEQTLPKMLGSFAGTVLDSASPIPDLYAAAIIKYYAYQGKQKAQEVDILLSAFGLRKLIQDVTGYTSSSKVYQLTDILFRSPAAWELMFTSEWIAEAEKLTGWKWSYRCMGKFINNCVYAYLPSEVVEALKGLNPVNDNGSRDYKHHQFLQPEIRDRVTAHLQGVELLMKAAKGNMKIFEALMINSYGSFKLSGQDDMPLFRAETVFMIKSGV